MGCLFVRFSAYNGSPSIHSLPQLSGSPVMRGQAGRCVNLDSGSTVPSFTRPVRPNMDQLQLQLQQRLGQQRIRNERDAVDWRPVSDCGVTDDTHGISAPFSRYSAPPTAGALVKSGPAIRLMDKATPTTFIPSSSQQHTPVMASSSSSSPSPAMKPGHSLPAPRAPIHSQPSGSAKSAGSGTSPVVSSVTVSRASPTMASHHVRSATPLLLSVLVSLAYFSRNNITLGREAFRGLVLTRQSATVCAAVQISPSVSSDVCA